MEVRFSGKEIRKRTKAMNVDVAITIMYIDHEHKYCVRIREGA